MQKASRKVGSPRVVCVDDFRLLARRRLPTPVFDYLDGGAEGEVTLRENCRVFADVTFRPRQAVAVSACDVRTRVLGFDVSFPALQDKAELDYLNQQPTSFVLPAEAVDRLRAAAGTIILASPEFQRLLNDLGAKVVAEPPATGSPATAH